MVITKCLRWARKPASCCPAQRPMVRSVASISSVDDGVAVAASSKVGPPRVIGTGSSEAESLISSLTLGSPGGYASWPLGQSLLGRAAALARATELWAFLASPHTCLGPRDTWCPVPDTHVVDRVLHGVAGGQNITRNGVSGSFRDFVSCTTRAPCHGGRPCSEADKAPQSVLCRPIRQNARFPTDLPSVPAPLFHAAG